MPESGHSGEQVVDITVVGGGFAGLTAADRLTTLGYRVAVIERAPRVLAGTSSRNEGWLHAEERTDEVADVDIGTRMVAASLVQQLRSRGARFFVGVHAERTGADRLTLRSASGAVDVRFRYLVVAAGYSMEQTTSDLGLEPVRVRLWRSHLLTAPRAAALSVFSVAPGDASMVNHGQWSIIGLNEDATVVHAPTTEPDPTVATLLTEAVLRRFPSVDMSQANVRACVEVGYARSANNPRSLNVRVLPVAQDAAVLPGKMTEAPVVADSVAHLVVQDLGSPDVSDRPVDALFAGATLG